VQLDPYRPRRRGRWLWQRQVSVVMRSAAEGETADPRPAKETVVFVYRLTEPIDEFDGLTPLPDWLKDASPHTTRWALQAVLALADAAPVVAWRGDMRHLPSVGVALSPPGTAPYLLVKQDDNGVTFVVTSTEAAWIAADTVAACTQVEPRHIGPWTHPTADDIPRDIESAFATPHRLGSDEHEPAF
jgi:hypothetical protein